MNYRYDLITANIGMWDRWQDLRCTCMFRLREEGRDSFWDRRIVHQHPTEFRLEVGRKCLPAEDFGHRLGWDLVLSVKIEGRITNQQKRSPICEILHGNL
jgi:hypothetical protein